MEVGEKTSKRGFAVNRCIEFTLETRYVYVKVRQLPVTFNLRGEGYTGVLLVEIFKEEREIRGSGIGKETRTSEPRTSFR